jgi:hypothetical protein
VAHEARNYTLTSAGQVMGTPYYMAPEQTEHPRNVDHRADIYSLGVVFYQMLTGELPLGRFAPPSQKVHIDVRLDEVVLRALEKEPERRYQQVSEIKTQIESISTGQSPSQPMSTAAIRTEAVNPRFSKTAIIGAVWAPFFFAVLSTMFVFSVAVQTGSQPPGPQWWQTLLALTLLPLGFLAPFGTTILGIVALTQIRHSAGKLCGLGLALFDALLFPLLFLDALIAVAWHVGLVSAGRAFGVTDQPSNVLVLLLTVITSIVVDFLIARAAWRAVRQPVNGDNLRQPPSSSEPNAARPQPPQSPADQAAIEQARHQVQAPAIGLMILSVLHLLAIPLATSVLLPAIMAAERAAGSAGGVIPFIIAISCCVIANILVIVAAAKMKQLQAHGLAVAGAILAILSANPLSIALGIWALVVLTQQEVRKAFWMRSSTPIANPVPIQARRLGLTAFLLCLLAIPISVLLAWFVHHAVPGSQPSWATIFLPLFVLEFLALICGIFGRKSGLGIAAIVISSIILLIAAPIAIYDATQIAPRASSGNNSVAATPPNKPATHVAFDPPIERVVEMDSRRKCAIDFDSGEFRELPLQFREASDLDWVRSNGVDAMAIAGKGIRTFDMQVVPIDYSTLAQLDAAFCEESFYMRPTTDSATTTVQDMDLSDPLPTACAFRTREGGTGMLEILGVAADPTGVKIRYKLVRGSANRNKPAEPSAPNPVPPEAAAFYDSIRKDVLDAMVEMKPGDEENLRDLRAKFLPRYEKLREMLKGTVAEIAYGEVIDNQENWEKETKDEKDDWAKNEKMRQFAYKTQCVENLIHGLPLPEKPAPREKPAEPQGPKLIFEIDPDKDRYPSGSFADGMSAVLMDGVLNVVDRRLNTGKPRMAEVRKIDDRRLEIALMRPDENDVNRVKRLLGSAGTIAFHILATERDKEIVERARKDETQTAVLDAPPVGPLAYWVPRSEKAGDDLTKDPQIICRTRKDGDREITEVLVLVGPNDVSGAYLKQATAEKDSLGHPCIRFTFNEVGGKMFAKLTGEHLPEKEEPYFKFRLGVILDGKLHSAPSIMSTVSEKGEISGNFTEQEAADLADILSAGSLPVRLRLVEAPAEKK